MKGAEARWRAENVARNSRVKNLLLTRPELSLTAIADKCGCSKNVVVGISARLRASGVTVPERAIRTNLAPIVAARRGQPLSEIEMEARKRRAELRLVQSERPARVAPVAPKPAPAPIIRRMPAVIRHKECQWPLWPHRDRPPRPPRFCCAPTVDGQSWCVTHAHKVHQPQPKEPTA